MSIADIALLALIAIFAILGFFKGFYKSLGSFLGFVVSLLLAYFLSKVTAKAFLSVNTMGKWFVGADKSLFTFIRGKMPAALSNISIEAMREAFAAGGIEALDALVVGTKGNFISSTMIKIFYPAVHSAAPGYLIAANASAADVVALELSFTIMVIASGIALFIVLRLIAACINHIVGKMVAGKKRNPLSRLLGLGIGALKGLVYGMVIITILSFMSGYGFMSSVKKQLDDSAFAKPIASATSKISEKVFSDKDNDPRFKRILELAGLEIL